MDERLARRFADAGTTFERRDDGHLAVTNWPRVRVSNPTFLSDEFERYAAERPDEQK